MDDLRDRYKIPGSDTPAPVHEALRHAYQPPPRPAAPVSSSAPPAVPRPEAPAQPASRPAQTAPPAENYKRADKKLWLKLAVLAVVLSALAGAGVYAYPRYFNPNPFPASIRHDAQLSLLYPSKLPAGFQIDKTSFSLANNILIYSAVNGGSRIAFTLQPVPANFDFSAFSKQLSGGQQFLTAFGQAAVGKSGGHYLGSLPDGDTWLLISSNSPAVSQDDIALVMRNLKNY